MAHGKTLELIQFSKTARWRRPDPRGKVDRDRSLAGKDRIRARKAARIIS
jgi:hypothetical protein